VSLLLSTLFERPLLIYDDNCRVCGQFAVYVNHLSRGWIRLAGHYDSYEVNNAKSLIFPSDYDSTRMFWLINAKGAFGGRAALLPLFVEIIKGAFRKTSEVEDPNYACRDIEKRSCSSPCSTFARMISLFKNSKHYRFGNLNKST
jgi:hypothetical protein